MGNLQYLSTTTLDRLRSSISDNLIRYRENGFNDMADHNGWTLELNKAKIDKDRLSDLHGGVGSEYEVSNSLVVFESLTDLTPAMANEERIWVRLCHVECIKYSRQRWPLKDIQPKKKSFLANMAASIKNAGTDAIDQKDIKQITKHFFAKGRPGIRDDNAISRLWWNAQIAKLIEPSDSRRALNQLLKTADIRASLIERPLLSNRIKLLRGIVHFMEANPEIAINEKSFRDFIKSVNFNGGGRFFEVMSESSISKFVNMCASNANNGIFEESA
jgi:hypothetical protein